MITFNSFTWRRLKVLQMKPWPLRNNPDERGYVSKISPDTSKSFMIESEEICKTLKV